MSVENLVRNRIGYRELKYETTDKLLSLVGAQEFVKAAHEKGKTVILIVPGYGSQ